MNVTHLADPSSIDGRWVVNNALMNTVYKYLLETLLSVLWG